MEFAQMGRCLLLFSLFAGLFAAASRPSARGPTETQKRNFYDFDVTTIDGVRMELDEFRGQVLLVVNVASQCGFTDGHYKSIVRLHQVLGSTGKFNVLGFPCNQFGNQEPDKDEDILKFAKDTYNVDFPLFTKANVVEPHAHPVYKYLIEMTGSKPNWNFWKYLVDHKGNVIGSWGPWIDVEEIAPIIRTAVHEAVKADPRPNKEASGPPQKEHEDYGDGAGGGYDIWSEGMYGDDDSRKVERASAGGNEDSKAPDTNPSEGSSEGPAAAGPPSRGAPGTKPNRGSEPGVRATAAIHDDL